MSEGPNLAAFRAAIESERAAKQVTLDQLAVLAGIDRATVIRVLRGQRTRGGSIESWWRIARALDLDLARFIHLLDG